MATLDTLELIPEQVDHCRDEVRKLAYQKWQEAGCPAGRHLEFWTAAEHEWIGHNYVPCRPLECDSPKCASKQKRKRTSAAAQDRVVCKPR